MIFWITTILGIIGTVVGILAFLFPDMGSRFVLLFKPWPRYNWHAIPKEVAHARRRVYILQTWLPGLRLELPYWEKALKQKVEFRVLLLDEKLVPFRLKCRERVSSLLPQNVSDLADLSQRFNLPDQKHRLEVKFYSCLPFGPIYLIDQDIYWGLYLSDQDSMLGPVFHCRSGSTLGQKITDSYEKIWETASASTGSLSVFQEHRHRAVAHIPDESEVERKTASFSSILCRLPSEQIIRINPDQGYLCIIRHSDTDLNAAGIIAGDLNIGINVIGREKARLVGQELRRQHWNRVYSSPLRRCIETLAEAFAGKIGEIELRDELKERAMGDAEGYLKEHYTSSLPQYHGIDLLSSFHAAPAGGESYRDVFWRMMPLLEEIIEKVRKQERVLICTHEGPIRMMRVALGELAIGTAINTEIQNCEMFYFAERSGGN